MECILTHDWSTIFNSNIQKVKKSQLRCVLSWLSNFLHFQAVNLYKTFLYSNFRVMCQSLPSRSRDLNILHKKLFKNLRLGLFHNNRCVFRETRNQIPYHIYKMSFALYISNTSKSGKFPRLRSSCHMSYPSYNYQFRKSSNRFLLNQRFEAGQMNFPYHVWL